MNTAPVACFLALACLLAGVSAQGSDFPYCDCVRPTGPSTSPYVLTPTTTTNNPDGSTKICWALTTYAAATGPCAKFDLKKIELNINTGCRSAVKSVVFGSDTFSPSYAAYPSLGGMSFKITRGNRDLATYNDLSGKTTPVCITLAAKQSCSSLATFCRDGKCDYAFFSTNNKCCPGQNLPSFSPPPPVSITPFPYCACNQNPAFNSFSLSPSDVAPTPVVSNGRNTYCWDLAGTRYTGNATSCVNFDLKKIEWDIKTGCQNAVTAVTLNGQAVAPSYARYPKLGGLVFKITRGSSDLASLDSLVAKPARVCMTLNSICPTLASLCKTPFCRVAYFSSSNKCCPLQSLVNSA